MCSLQRGWTTCGSTQRLLWDVEWVGEGKVLKTTAALRQEVQFFNVFLVTCEIAGRREKRKKKRWEQNNHKGSLFASTQKNWTICLYPTAQVVNSHIRHEAFIMKQCCCSSPSPKPQHLQFKTGKKKTFGHNNNQYANTAPCPPNWAGSLISQLHRECHKYLQHFHHFYSWAWGEPWNDKYKYLICPEMMYFQWDGGSGG